MIRTRDFGFGDRCFSTATILLYTPFGVCTVYGLPLPARLFRAVRFITPKCICRLSGLSTKRCRPAGATRNALGAVRPISVLPVYSRLSKDCRPSRLSCRPLWLMRHREHIARYSRPGLAVEEAKKVGVPAKSSCTHVRHIPPHDCRAGERRTTIGNAYTSCYYI